MPWVAPTTWAMLRAGGGWAVVSGSCRISGRGAGNRERWTDLCWAPSVLQQIDSHHRSTFATWITSHSSLQLSGCNFASQGLASLSKKPPMCSTAAPHCSTWISAPAWLSPFLPSQNLLPFNPLASLSPEKPVLPQSRCSLCCERMAREERMSLPVSSLSCRQVLCPHHLHA